MEAAAHGHSTLGIPRSVGKEFVAGDATAGHASGILFVAPDGDILLLRRSSTEKNFAGHWALPGGKAEKGEGPYDAALREVEEETGYHPDDDKARLIDQRITPTGMAFHTFAMPVAEKFAPTLNEEHSGFAWAPLDQMPQPLHPAVAATLADRLGTAEDMTPEDWQGLRSGFAKWTREEEAEPEHAADALALDRASVRDYDADGRLHVSATPISKANICEYWGREIPGAEQLGLQPDRKYRLLRHPDELRRAADTFNNLPLLRRHVPVSAGDHRPEDVIGSTGTDATFDDPYLMNSLVVWSKDDIEEIERDLKKELSSAYRYRPDMTPGAYESEPYDGVMRDIVGNHVALVVEGRAGPDVVVGDSAITTPIEKDWSMAHAKALSRQALLASGALLAYLPGKLAADAKLGDFRPLLADVTAKNWKDSQPKIIAGVTALMDGKLAKDAKLDGLAPLLLALDEVEEDLPEPGGGKGKGPAKDRKGKDAKAKDGKAMDRKARDEAREELKEKLKDKLSAEDWKAACDDIDGMEAEDEETEEERKEREAEGQKAKDEEMKIETKKAMDEAMAGERQRQRDVREAERFVRPWVGDLAIAYDSAEEVFHAAIEARGKATKGIHPSAYRSILEMLPKPGAEHRPASNRPAMDAAGAKSFGEMFPGAMDIRVNA